MAGNRARQTGSSGLYAPAAAPRQEVSAGKRIKAIPFSGGTTIVVRSIDFKNAGNIEHADVTWDYRVNDFSVEVGNEISEEAADFLVNSYPNSFAFVKG